MTWLDVTREASERVDHPGQPTTWSCWNWNDRWFGVLKRTVIWFEYEGKRFVPTFQDGEWKPLLESIAPPADKRTFVATIQHDHWTNGRQAIPLASNSNSFGVITQIAGKFLGYGEKVGLSVAPNKAWQIDGHTQHPLAAHAATFTSPLRNQFEEQIEEFSWSAGNPPAKMLRSDEGFCVLASMGGNFAGLGESIGIDIDSKDGYWYLRGTAGSGAVATKALAYRLKPTSKLKLRYTIYSANGAPNAQLIHQNEGLCYLAGVAVSMRGFGEQARVVLSEDGFWVLAPQNIYARAIVVRFE